MSTLPDAIRALVGGEGKVEIASIPFGNTNKVQNLAPHEVIVHVRAVGLNPTDWKYALGELGYGGNVCGCDSSGDVAKIGSGVKNVAVGDRVAGFVFGTTQKDNGSFADYVRMDSATLFKLPSDMSYEEGASLPIPHFTAVQALYMHLNLPMPSAPADKSDIILIWGGSTAVGHQAVQLAHLSGFRVFVTASHAAHETLKKLGAEACFDYHASDIAQKIKNAANPTGIKVSLDTVCEKGSTDHIVDVIAGGGHVVTTLPVSPETSKRRSDVKVESILVYTLLGYEFTFGKDPGLHFPQKPHDHERIAEYLSKELSPLLEDWEAGSGSSNIKPQILKKMEGGYEGIIEGLRIMQKGEYSREKIVVKLA